MRQGKAGWAGSRSQGTTIEGDLLDLEVIIGELGHAAAGDYQDVITITVSPQ